MSLSAPKLLFLPNEPVLGWQSGPRRYFEEAKAVGILSGYETVSFEFEAQGRNDDDVCQNILQAAERLQPDIILWQHISNFKASRDFLKRIRNVNSRPTLVYHEADMYGSLREIKTASQSMKVLASEADILFVVGLGNWISRLKSYGAKDVRYAPHFYDPAKFGGHWTPAKNRQFDVVLIGHRIKSRIPVPGRGIPGAAKREELAYKLHEALGDRFGLFGRGWESTGFSRGALPFDQQEAVLRDSWMSVIWDHFDEIPFYFSDRLPISMAAGVLHITNYHSGYDSIFSNGETMAYCRSVEEMLDTVHYYLSCPRDIITKIGMAGREFAKTRLTVDVVMGEMLREIIEYRTSEIRKECNR